MLRTALAERLGFQYHLVDRQTPVYYLVRGSGALKLVPSTESEPEHGYLASFWLFRRKSAPLSDFARFLSSVAGRDVIDKTGIDGRYQFDLDWRSELEQEGGPRSNGPGQALEGAKSLGLKLEPGKEMRKVLVVDHVNKYPTPN
jgi:uncharacterized protein (TIGR03435 family)